MTNRYLFGRKALLDAINNGLLIKNVYLANNNNFDLTLLKQKKINFCFKPNSFFQQFGLNKIEFVVFELNYQNSKINLNELVQILSKKNNSLILMLDEIQDVGNMGAILRTAEVFGVDGVIYKKDNQADPFNNICIRNSLNAISYLKMCEVTNLTNAIKQLQEAGFWVYASSLTSNSTSYITEKYANKTVIIVGNENRGISSLVLKNADEIVHIPQYGHIQSLNVSVATGILLADYRIKNPKNKD